MYNLHWFETEVEHLNKRIEKHYEPYERDEDREIIKDGLADIGQYYNAGIKILWILKEAYNSDEPGEGGWDITSIFNADMIMKNKARSTWFPIVYTTYAIINGIEQYNDMDDIVKKPEMCNVLNKIAFMNVSKFAGNTTSNNAEISKEYLIHRDILLDQIRVYNPDIIIGGNTIYNFINDLKLSDDVKKFDEYEYWVKEGKIFIDADHPARKKGTEWEEEFCNTIIKIAKAK